MLFQRPSGFTLLELILVVLIIAVASALVGPAISNRLLRADARRTALEVRSAMESLRVYAVRSGKEEIMILDPEENTYWREGGGNTITVSSDSGILSARSPWTRENGQVEFHFYPDGTNSGGTIRVEQDRSIAATAYIVLLDPLLGIATITRDD